MQQNLQHALKKGQTFSPKRWYPPSSLYTASSLGPHLDRRVQKVSVAVDRDDEEPPLHLPQKRHLLEGPDFVQRDRVAGFGPARDFFPVNLRAIQKFERTSILLGLRLHCRSTMI